MSEEIDTIVENLFEKGFSKVDSIRYLRDRHAMDLQSATLAVHNSKMWSSQKEKDERNNGIFFEEARKMKDF